MVVSCPDIPDAPASPCNINHCEPINCKLKPGLELLLAEYNFDYLLKNRKAKALRMRSQGHKGMGVYMLPTSPAKPNLSLGPWKPRILSVSRQSSSPKLRSYGDRLGRAHAARGG